MADPAGMFDKLAQNRQKAKAAPPPEPAPGPKQRQRRALGKRSDPDYIQVGAYIPKALNKDVKRLLVDVDQDFSELVAELLQKWVKRQSR